MLSRRNKGQKLVSRYFENQTFCRLLIVVPLKMYSKFGRLDFGQPNVEIGRKMSTGQLLFLALYGIHVMCKLLCCFAWDNPWIVQIPTLHITSIHSVCVCNTREIIMNCSYSYRCGYLTNQMAVHGC